jgi:catechol 2,3-dioxygenase
MGTVHLTVADLSRSVDYYERAIGLRVHERDGGIARLGTGGEDLLVLCEQPGAGSAEGFAGLFHFALLVPTRADLARFLAHAARDRVQLMGLSDHAVSEAIYLRDPDHHGIEVYADRPREAWEGRVFERMTTLPLDTDDLLAAANGSSFDGLPAGTTMGHVHLCVAAIEPTIGFYRDVLGLDLVAALGNQAAFLSAGGYHHHVGANTWQSRGAPFAPDDRARLTRVTLVVPDEDDLDGVESLPGASRADGGVVLVDPAGNPLIVTAHPNGR